jgi:hypothetical protein
MALPDNSISNFAWVSERAKCTTLLVFKEIEIGVNDDIKEINSLRSKDSLEFRIVSNNNGDCFEVFRDKDAARSIIFRLINDEISISNRSGDLTFSATLALNNKGQCRLNVNGEELEQWQVRRKALEGLFFGI